eukprot:COSAG01_NODE_2667_length_7280_cov_384.625400_6_plen_122_part_00
MCVTLVLGCHRPGTSSTRQQGSYDTFLEGRAHADHSGGSARSRADPHAAELSTTTTTTTTTTGETTGDLLAFTAVGMKELFVLMKVNVLGRNRIQRWINSVHKRLCSALGAAIKSTSRQPL